MNQEIANASTGEIVVSEDGLRQDIAALHNTGAGMYSSIQGTDFASKLRVVNAISDSKPISENLNKKIELTNIVVQPIEMQNEETKQMEWVPRIILLDKDDNAFHAISGGIFKSVQNILGILGEPSTWAAPVPVKVVQEGQGNRKYFTIKPA